MATKEPYLSHLLGSFLNGSAGLRSAWRSAAIAAGRPDVADLSEQVEWRSKGGSYGTSSTATVSTSGGILWLPVKLGSTIQRRPSVIATFFDSDDLRGTPGRACIPKRSDRWSGTS